MKNAITLSVVWLIAGIVLGYSVGHKDGVHETERRAIYAGHGFYRFGSNSDGTIAEDKLTFEWGKPFAVNGWPSGLSEAEVIEAAAKIAGENRK